MASQTSPAGVSARNRPAASGKLPRWLCRGLPAATALLASIAILAAVLFPETWLCVENPIHRSDVIVVLGGDMRRSEKVVQLFQNQSAPRIVISGAGDWPQYQEYLIRAGVPAQAIAVEDQSLTTFENARQTTRWLTERQVRSAILVTSWFHSRRALYTFRKLAPNVDFQSAPTYLTRRPHSLGMTPGEAGTIMREYVKLFGYCVWHGVWPLGAFPLAPPINQSSVSSLQPLELRTESSP